MSQSQEAEKRILSMQARFVAYLEKHRIYELFYELATQLAIQKPADHLAFMKQYFQLAARKRDATKVILIAPPHFDKMGLANVLQEELGVHPVTLKTLRDALRVKDGTCRCVESEDLALALKKILESGVLHECGWVLVDFPRTKKEAREFQRIGIIPTHVIQLIPSQESRSWNNVCPSTDCQPPPYSSKTPSQSPEERRYLKNLRGLREAYANYLIEIEVGIRSIRELGQDCAKLTKTKKHRGAPSLFRIVLIGSRGSGCSTLAKYISERFNLVHVDYDYIEEQARLQQTALGEMLRLFEFRCGDRSKPRIRVQIVEKHLSDYECLRRGWVLTGYPKSVEDFKLLDMIPTPPNRVIFVDVNGDVCRERLLNRRYNIVTGSKHNLSSMKYCDRDDCDLALHPRDYRMTVERDLQEYEENVDDMMEYAGESAAKVDGNEEERTVREKVEACLIHPAPCSQPRIPKPPSEVDPNDVEYDPDDEPDSTVFDDIRAPEPKYTFI